MAVTRRKQRKNDKVDGAEANVQPPNPPRGARGDFIKITVTLAPDAYKLLMDEATRRKVAKEPNPILSAIIREAVQAYLTQTLSARTP